jgi:fatty-acyl-CoA synthase
LPVRHYDWIAHFGRRTPEKTAVVDLASERRFTYAQFDARISRLAAHLRDRLEVARGDRVAVLALNTTDTLEVQFACGRLGAIFLPLNTRFTVPELQFIVNDAQGHHPRRRPQRSRACGRENLPDAVDPPARRRRYL